LRIVGGHGRGLLTDSDLVRNANVVVVSGLARRNLGSLRGLRQSRVLTLLQAGLNHGQVLGSIVNEFTISGRFLIAALDLVRLLEHVLTILHYDVLLILVRMSLVSRRDALLWRHSRRVNLLLISQLGVRRLTIWHIIQVHLVHVL
jgi:hypothetical protein